MVVATAGPRGTGAPVLAARDLFRFFHLGDDETFALRGVSLTAIAGEMLAVIGPSGSGKSTLLACLAGFDEPDGGHVLVAGQRMTRRPETVRAKLRSRWIGVVLQSGNLLDHLTVAQNIDLVRALHGDGDRTRSVSDVLIEVGLEDRASAWPSTLSGGEAARAGVAVAIANDPTVILADEPTGEVDEENESRILSLLQRNTEAGAGVVVVTHSDRIASAADRVLRLSDGAIVDG